MWPGFGDNLRVLLWVMDRCEGKVDAVETPLGYVPIPGDINTEGMDISDETKKKLMLIDKNTWMNEIEDLKEFYKRFNGDLPKTIKDCFYELADEFNKMQ